MLLTFHSGFTFFCVSLLVQALFQTSSCTSFTNQKGLEIWKSAVNSYEKQKHMNPLWMVESFEQHTSWKVRIPECIFHEK